MLSKFCITVVLIFKHVLPVLSDWPSYRAVTYMKLTVLEMQFCLSSRKAKGNHASTTEAYMFVILVCCRFQCVVHLLENSQILELAEAFFI